MTKELLQVIVNHATEAQATAFLSDSGVVFKTEDNRDFTVDAEGHTVNLEGQVDSYALGRVCGFELPEGRKLGAVAAVKSPDPGRRDPGRNELGRDTPRVNR